MMKLALLVCLTVTCVFAVQLTSYSFNNASGVIEGVDYNFNVVVGDLVTGSSESSSFRFNVGHIAVLTGLDDVEERPVAAKPDEFAIISAYPNPFNSQCRIDFSLDKDSNLHIAIFSIDGKQMLSNSAQFNAGKHSLVWDAEDAESGVYLFKLTNSEQTLTRRISLIK